MKANLKALCDYTPSLRSQTLRSLSESPETQKQVNFRTRH